MHDPDTDTGYQRTLVTARIKQRTEILRRGHDRTTNPQRSRRHRRAADHGLWRRILARRIGGLRIQRRRRPQATRPPHPEPPSPAIGHNRTLTQLSWAVSAEPRAARGAEGRRMPIARVGRAGSDRGACGRAGQGTQTRAAAANRSAPAAGTDCPLPAGSDGTLRGVHAGCAGQSWLVGEDLAEQPDRAFVIHSAEFSTGAQVRLNGTSSPRLRPGVAPRGIGGEPAKRGLSGGP